MITIQLSVPQSRSIVGIFCGPVCHAIFDCKFNDPDRYQPVSGSFFSPEITRCVVVVVVLVVVVVDTVDNRISCRPRCRVRTQSISRWPENEEVAEVVIVEAAGEKLEGE